jgi:hypothetical protein
VLYVSFWAIVLSNLPGGSFTKRALSDDETAELIATARKQEKLAASVDLFARHAQRNRDLHLEVCQALSRRGIELSIKDFSSGDYCTPIALARVGLDSPMLVLDCAFELNAENRAHAEGEGSKERPSDRSESPPTPCGST